MQQNVGDCVQTSGLAFDREQLSAVFSKTLVRYAFQWRRQYRSCDRKSKNSVRRLQQCSLLTVGPLPRCVASRVLVYKLPYSNWLVVAVVYALEYVVRSVLVGGQLQSLYLCYVAEQWRLFKLLSQHARVRLFYRVLVQRAVQLYRAHALVYIADNCGLVVRQNLLFVVVAYLVDALHRVTVFSSSNFNNSSSLSARVIVGTKGTVSVVGTEGGVLHPQKK